LSSAIVDVPIAKKAAELRDDVANLHLELTHCILQLKKMQNPE
jgi:hypothetical protein